MRQDAHLRAPRTEAPAEMPLTSGGCSAHTPRGRLPHHTHTPTNHRSQRSSPTCRCAALPRVGQGSRGQVRECQLCDARRRPSARGAQRAACVAQSAPPPPLHHTQTWPNVLGNCTRGPHGRRRGHWVLARQKAHLRQLPGSVATRSRRCWLCMFSLRLFRTATQFVSPSPFTESKRKLQRCFRRRPL